MRKKNYQLLQKLLSIIKFDVLPKTRIGVKNGNKIFGAAIIKKSNLEVVTAETNNEIVNPLFHGEISCLNSFFSSEKHGQTSDLIFLSTHEPCSMCLSAIAWAGFDKVYYFFSHEDSRDEFKIPHDLRILKELFNIEPGAYNKINSLLSCHSIPSLVERLQSDKQSYKLLQMDITEIKAEYRKLSANYQASKGKNFIPFN